MFTGNCHCGNIELSVSKLTDTATTCTCSICSRYAALWGYFTQTEVTVSIGKFGAKQYSHGDKLINFIHCKNCGCLTHYASTQSGPEERLVVNYRMFGKTVLDKLLIRVFDGADTWQYID